MTFHRFVYVITIFCLSLSIDTFHLTAQQENQENNVGIVLSVKGKSLITRLDDSKIQADFGTLIRIGDRIETEYRAFLQIEFIDRSKINLLGGSDITVDDYFFKDGDEKSRLKVSVNNGAMGFMAGKIAKTAAKNYKIHTVMAAIGIRGSSGELEFNNSEFSEGPSVLKVMKTGGIGLTVALNEEGAPKIEDLLETGTGIICDADLGIERIHFSESILKSYSKNNETIIQKRKKEKIKSSDFSTQSTEKIPEKSQLKKNNLPENMLSHSDEPDLTVPDDMDEMQDDALQEQLDALTVGISNVESSDVDLSDIDLSEIVNETVSQDTTQTIQEEIANDIAEEIAEIITEEFDQNLRDEAFEAIKDGVKRAMEDQVIADVLGSMMLTVENNLSASFNTEVVDKIVHKLRDKIKKDIDNVIKNSLENSVEDRMLDYVIQEVGSRKKNIIKETVRAAVIDEVANGVSSSITENIDSDVKNIIEQNLKNKFETDISNNVEDAVHDGFKKDNSITLTEEEVVNEIQTNMGTVIEEELQINASP